MNKRKLWIPLALSCMLIISGCGLNTSHQTSKNLSPESSSSLQVPAEKEATLHYYKSSDDGMKLIPVTKKVPAKDNTAKTAIEEMLRADRKAKYPILPAGLSLKNISIENGTAYVNFNKEANDIKGSTVQTLFIAMTVDTLTEFPNIRQVVLTAEGKPLQFQIDMSEPFKRDEGYILMEKK